MILQSRRLDCHFLCGTLFTTHMLSASVGFRILQKLLRLHFSLCNRATFYGIVVVVFSLLFQFPLHMCVFCSFFIAFELHTRPMMALIHALN